MNPENAQEVLAEAKKWWDKLPTTIIQNLAAARVLINETHGYKADRPFENYLSDIMLAARRYEGDALETFALISAIAVRAMEQIEKDTPCNCPACELRRQIKAVQGVEVDPEAMNAAQSFVQMQMGPASEGNRFTVISIDSPEQLAGILGGIFGDKS